MPISRARRIIGPAHARRPACGDTLAAADGASMPGRADADLLRAYASNGAARRCQRGASVMTASTGGSPRRARREATGRKGRAQRTRPPVLGALRRYIHFDDMRAQLGSSASWRAIEARHDAPPASMRGQACFDAAAAASAARRATPSCHEASGYASRRREADVRDESIYHQDDAAATSMIFATSRQSKVRMLVLRRHHLRKRSLTRRRARVSTRRAIATMRAVTTAMMAKSFISIAAHMPGRIASRRISLFSEFTARA